MRFVFNGNPIPKARAKKGRTKFYDPQNELKETARWIIKTQILNAINNTDLKIKLEASNLAKADAFHVDLHFHLPYNKNFSQFKINAVSWGLILHTSKPDFDNLAKFYTDQANGLIWHDDSQIVSGHIYKLYSDKPKTIMDVMPKKPIDISDEFKKIVDNFSCDDLFDFTQEVKALKIHLDIYQENLYKTTSSDILEKDQAQIVSSLESIGKKYGKQLVKIAKA